MIFLYDEEIPYLLSLLRRQPTFWIRDNLIKKVASEIERKKEIERCEHEGGKYVGTKTCCAKCGSYFELGMGFEWTKQEV